jgi:hypothetical protein
MEMMIHIPQPLSQPLKIQVVEAEVVGELQR